MTAQWFAMRAGEVDPAPIPTQWVFWIKIAGGVLFVAALILTLPAPARTGDTPERLRCRIANRSPEAVLRLTVVAFRYLRDYE